MFRKRYVAFLNELSELAKTHGIDRPLGVRKPIR
jgi:hypothetical protein